jgi:hypothetical protein
MPIFGALYSKSPGKLNTCLFFLFVFGFFFVMFVSFDSIIVYELWLWQFELKFPPIFQVFCPSVIITTETISKQEYDCIILELHLLTTKFVALEQEN